MKKAAIVFVSSLLFFSVCLAQSPIKKIQPAFWYAGMKHSELQILIYGDHVSDWNIAFSNLKLIELKRPNIKIVKTENPNYLFVYIETSNLEPQTLNIIFTKGKKSFSQPYELKAQTRPSESVKGFDESDLIYMLMPDRFSNGNPSNDVVSGMLESKVDRSNPGGRHGGDLQGVINHLDYIKDLGATTLWLNPAWENDQPEYSYHGYACTDVYKIDARYGTNEKYRELVAEAHKRELKVIMDYIYNHMGNQNWFIKDLPSPDWIHQFKKFTRCNYRPASLADPYGSQYDRKLNNDGWFDHHMPDLNQTNRLLADYLIQNTIWWVEYAGIDGYRIDTYPYPDNDFMNECLRRLYDEYPNISVVGETWEQTVADVAYWQKNSPIRRDGKQNELESVTDFNWFFAVKDGLKEPFGWTTGERKIYYMLAQDFLYADPFKNMIFLDNHDVNRIYSELGEDFNKWKQAVALLMTMRGIPCLYYGTEILMSGLTNPTDGQVRKDFPGGWPGDSVNKFSESGRTPKEQEAFTYVQKLAQFRKAYPVVQTGKLMQFIPDDDVYVYFRYNEKNCVMVAINTSDTLKKLDSSRYAERLNGYKKGFDVYTGGMYSDLNDLSVEAHGVMIWNLRRD